MITITIPGIPVGKQRPKFARRGNFVKAYTPAKTVSYENLVKMAAAQAMGDRAPLDCALAVELYLFVTPPESWSNKKKLAALSGEIRPTSGRSCFDIDNYQKSIFDGANGILWLDDKQIVEVIAKKSYGTKAEAIMTVRAA